MTEASSPAHYRNIGWAALWAAMHGLLMPTFLASALAVSAAAEQGPRVTTDSVEYCGSLVARLSTLPAAEREPSRSLAAEGVRLCDTGHVRTGIAKLRRAVRAAQAMP
jgi:hypothetical protein